MDYNKRIIEYLESIGVTARIKPCDKQDCPSRCEPYRCTANPQGQSRGERPRMVPHNHGWKYELTLTRKDRAPMVIDGFWNSIKSRYDTLAINGELKPGVIKATPSVYDMMSAYCFDFWVNSMTFKEYADEHGESDDSIKSKAAYDEACETAIRFQRFFSAEELNTLGEYAA